MTSQPYLTGELCQPHLRLFTAPDIGENKATTVQNLFIQKKGFIEGSYTWTIKDFLELDMKQPVRSPTFEVGGQRWYLKMYPQGDKCNTDCVSLYLYLDASDEFTPEPGKVVEMTLSILYQKDGNHFTRKAGPNVFVAGKTFRGSGWSNFIPLKTLKRPSRGFLVGSSSVVKVDFTIIGSSNDC